MAPDQTARSRELDCTVREVVRETADTVTLILDAGAGSHDYAAGQFVTFDPGQFPALRQELAFLEQLKGRRESVRAYSLSSIPDDPYLAVTIKEEAYVGGVHPYPPLLSPYLVHGLTAGARVVVRGFAGTYVLPEDAGSLRHLVHVVAGAGVVPNFSLLRFALAHLPWLRHTFVYSNRTVAETIFLGALEALAACHPDRLRLLFTYTREAGPVPGARSGRVDRELLAEALADPASCRVYACGPALTRWDRKAARARGEEPRPRFLETVQALLSELGVTKDRIRTEAYG